MYRLTQITSKVPTTFSSYLPLTPFQIRIPLYPTLILRHCLAPIENGTFTAVRQRHRAEAISSRWGNVPFPEGMPQVICIPKRHCMDAKTPNEDGIESDP